jgi:hypothetical protein
VFRLDTIQELYKLIYLLTLENYVYVQFSDSVDGDSVKHMDPDIVRESTVLVGRSAPSIVKQGEARRGAPHYRRAEERGWGGAGTVVDMQVCTQPAWQEIGPIHALRPA